VITYFGTYFAWVLVALNLISRGLIVPIVNDVSQILGAIPITRAAFTGLARPKGHAFKVTAKGGDRSRVVVQWGLMRPFLIMFGLTLLGVVLGIFSDSFAYNDAGDGKVVILFWTLYNLIVLAVTLLVCIELPRAELHVTDAPERAELTVGATKRRIWISELTSEAARIRGAQHPPGTELSLTIDGVGTIPGKVRSLSGDGMRLALYPDTAAHEALLVRLHAQGDAPGVTQTRLSALLTDLTRRLASRT